MRSLLVRWLVTAVAIFLVPQLISGVHVPNFAAALTMSAILGVLNLLVKPLLVILTLPLTLISLGVFYLVLNAFIFELAGKLVQGITVASFGDAFLAALWVSFVSWVLHLRRGGRSRIVWMNTGAPRGPSGPPPGPRPRPRQPAPSNEETIELHETDGGKWE